MKLGRLLNRTVRKTKAHYLGRKHLGPDGWLFFQAFDQADLLLSSRRESPAERRATLAWKQEYLRRFPSPPYFVMSTDYPVAADSDDHKVPRGSLRDNSANRAFNARLYAWHDDRPDLTVLDIGCAGGGFVRSVLEDGRVAVGVEGSDASRRAQSGEWATCPHHLFTADIGRPFRLSNPDGTPARFDVVTAWEVLEHLPEDRIPMLLGNIRDHLKPGGHFIGSVDTVPDGNPLTGAVYHLTMQPKSWWLAQFAALGFIEVTDPPFQTSDYVRGNGRTIKDWDPSAGDAFHLVLRYDG
jgi:2-polyprenyl-3-methyl-5-hydroxy-6-metoxy-1,4-benzoquinol methylase